MSLYEKVFENNKLWVAEKLQKDAQYFEKLAEGQTPEILYIGCSDSRVTAEDLMGVEPGQVFIHRNIANMVVSIDVNVMSVINYAVAHLKVKEIVVCGHYGCGGVKAALTPQDLGILNPWLRNIRDVYRLYEKELDAIPNETDRYNRLIELNVIEQCRNVIKTAVVQKQHKLTGGPRVHAWVFDIKTGLLKDLQLDFEATLKEIEKIYDLVP